MIAIRTALATASRAKKLFGVARAVSQTRTADPQKRQRAKRALANLLADARGIPMKMGQHLATLNEGEAYETLVTSVEPLPLEQIQQVLEDEWDFPADTVLSELHPSEAAASLGQVHRAQRHDGTEVAIKIRYPDIAQSVDAELRLAGMLPQIGPAKKWGFDLNAYRQMLKQDLDRELDYLGEAQRQKTFAQQVQIPGLVVPRVYEELCRPGVLVQSWESSVPLSSARQWPHAQRLALGQILMRTLFTSLFVTGEVHADPHPGNLGVRRTSGRSPEIVLMDFGCTVSVDPQARLALLKLISGCCEGDGTDAVGCLVGMGFDASKLNDISEQVPALCQILLEPFLSNQPYSTKYWCLSERMGKLLGELRWWFRSAAPTSMLFILRAFSGLVQQLETLGVMLPWRDVLVGTLTPSLMREVEAYESPVLVEKINRQTVGFDGLAKYLKVRVTEAGHQVVALTMPAGQVTELAEQMPDHVMDKLAEQKICVASMIDRVCKTGLVPQELFSLESGKRSYRVWLES